MENNKLFAEAARLRESTFTSEDIGNLAKFYKNTAESYRTKQVLGFKRQQELREEWEKRFTAAEQAFFSNKNKKFLPRFVDPVTNQTMLISSLIDESGKRRTYSDILSRDTSKGGNVFMLGKAAQETMTTDLNLEDWERTASTYETNFQEEVRLVEERNKAAREKFIREKNEKLNAMQQQSSAYNKPTYTEKPI
jgi:hypothetical protein